MTTNETTSAAILLAADLPGLMEPPVTFDLVTALADEISRLEEANTALRAELDAANDAVLELLHDLDVAREGRTEGGA